MIGSLRPYQLFRRSCGTFHLDPDELFCRPNEQFMRSAVEQAMAAC